MGIGSALDEDASCESRDGRRRDDNDQILEAKLVHALSTTMSVHTQVEIQEGIPRESPASPGRRYHLRLISTEHALGPQLG